MRDVPIFRRNASGTANGHSDNMTASSHLPWFYISFSPVYPYRSVNSLILCCLIYKISLNIYVGHTSYDIFCRFFDKERPTLLKIPLRALEILPL